MQVLAPLGTFVVVAVVGVTAALVGSGGGDPSPRPLRLASGSATAQDSSAAVAPTAEGKTAGGGGFTLTGTLPAGRPDDAPAWDLAGGVADADLVTRLAKALHITAPAVRDGKSWRAGGLYVSGDAGQSWYFSPCAAAQGLPVPSAISSAVSSDGSTVSSGCAVASPGIAVGEPVPDSAPAEPVPTPGTSEGSSGSGTAPSAGSGPGTVATPPLPPDYSPRPEPAPISKAIVHKAADPVLAALGLDPADATVETSGYGGSASLDRTVDGLPTVGLTTRVDVDREGTIQSANGALGDARQGDTYPLISATQAFDQLPAQPRILSCQVAPDGQGCVQPPATEVTGAHLGLLVQPLRDAGLVLVPAWLFEVKASTYPLAQVAVQPKYLEDPNPVATDQPAPPPAQVDPAPAQTTISIDAAFRAKTPNAVVVQYGDSGSCPHQNVTHQVKEADDAVYVFLQSDPLGKQACTEDYHPVKVTVELQAPLGDRKVIDAQSQRVVPVS